MRWLIAVTLVVCGELAALEPANALIVYNDKAGGSLEIAEYYAGVRGVPKEQILKISTSDQEEITRAEFNKDILAPVKEYVLAHDNILCIVPTRGVPLKVKDQDGVTKGQLEGHDEASVDSELMLVRAGEYDIDKALDSGYFKKETPLTLADKIVVVCRLDGPTVEIVKGMIEKAVIAEALTADGSSFLDTRNLTSADAYQARDDAMEGVGTTWSNLGIPFTRDEFSDVADLSTIKDLLHYQGWEASGHAPKDPVVFRTGAIAVHTHTGTSGIANAATVRGDKFGWAGPLLSWNATCTFGAVYVPYLEGFPYEDVFWDRIAKGWQFGEAGMAANKMVSWQSVFLGDPLYCPHGKGWKERKDRARKAVVARLVPGGDAVDEAGLLSVEACARALAARAELVAKLTIGDIKAGLGAYYEARVLVRGMGMEAWLAAVAKPFDPELRKRLEAMRAAAKEDMTATAELDAALVDWKGLPVYADVEKFRDDLGKAQEKEAAKLVKKAQSSQKNKQWLKAWREAAEAAAHKYAPSATVANTIMTDLKPNVAAVRADADRELKGDVEKAQKAFDKQKYVEAKKALGTEWKYYPDCTQRRAAEDLSRRIEVELKKGG